MFWCEGRVMAGMKLRCSHHLSLPAGRQMHPDSAKHRVMSVYKCKCRRLQAETIRAGVGVPVVGLGAGLGLDIWGFGVSYAYPQKGLMK